MNSNSTPAPPPPAAAAATQQELLTSYRDQNSEIIRNNARLNERIAILETVIRNLQQDNLQLRIENAEFKKKQQKNSTGIKKKKHQQQATRKRENSVEEGSAMEKKKRKEAKLKRQGIEFNDENKEARTKNERRACSSKPINYVLPNISSKLRQGDPFTFGNK